MRKIEVELSEDLESWLRSNASEFGFTPGQMLEHLVRLESGLRREDALGRRIPLRDMTYRQLTPPGNRSSLRRTTPSWIDDLGC